MIDFDTMNLKRYAPEQSQTDTIEYIFETLPVPDYNSLAKAYRAAVEGGICYMLSMEWLRLIITQDASWQQYGLFEQVVKNPAYYKQIMNNYFAYAFQGDYYTPGELIVFLTNQRRYGAIQADAEFVSLCMAKKASVDQTKGCRSSDIDQITNAVLDAVEQYMFIRLDMPEGAHRVAAYRESDQVWYFFDPNIGVIRVSGEERILKKKVRILWDYIWRLYKVKSVRVRYLRKNPDETIQNLPSGCQNLPF